MSDHVHWSPTVQQNKHRSRSCLGPYTQHGSHLENAKQKIRSAPGPARHRHGAATAGAAAPRPARRPSARCCSLLAASPSAGAGNQVPGKFSPSPSTEEGSVLGTRRLLVLT